MLNVLCVIENGIREVKKTFSKTILAHIQVKGRSRALFQNYIVIFAFHTLPLQPGLRHLQNDLGEEEAIEMIVGLPSRR